MCSKISFKHFLAFLMYIFIVLFFSLFLYTANSTKERKVCMPCQQELHGRQATKEQMPVLPLSEVPGSRHGQRR